MMFIVSSSSVLQTLMTVILIPGKTAFIFIFNHLPPLSESYYFNSRL